MLTVVLADEGQIHWDWCTPWDVAKPDQRWAAQLIATLNAWRTGEGRPFLCHGRMLRPYEILGAGETVDVHVSGREVSWPAVFTSRWASPDGREAQILVNYTPEPRTVEMPALHGARDAIIRRDPRGASGAAPDAGQLEGAIEIAPLSAVLIELGEPVPDPLAV